MKKNLYNIMNEAKENELDPLLKNIECEAPEGVCADNIAAKVAKKRRNAKLKMRTLWLRYSAAAACLALVVAAIPTAQYFHKSFDNKIYHEGANLNGNGISMIPEIGFVTSPSIAFDTSISYTYHLPLENGTCLAKEMFFKLEEGKMKETWRELLAPFFEHCGIDVKVADWKLTETDAHTQVSPDGKFVTHTPGVKTVHIYLEGEAVLDDHTLKCLVNTIDSITYARYIKLYYNGTTVSIEGKCPEEGFVNFKVDVSK